MSLHALKPWRTIALLACLGSTACTGSSNAPEVPPEPLTRSAAFSQERAWENLETLYMMGPRAAGLPGHIKARAYLESRLVEAGAKLNVDTFPHRLRGESKDREMSNISGLFGDPRKGLLLIGTHYDTRLWADEDPDRASRGTPIPGANDAGSGTAVLLEVARILGENPPPFGIEIAFFDGEEAGRPGRIEDYMVGSERMVERWTEVKPWALPDAVVVVDMVGDADLAIGPDRAAQDLYPKLNERFWRAATELKQPGFTTRLQGPVTDDHSAFMAKGIPSTVLIDFTYPYWHTVDDTIDKCSADSLGIVGRVLLEAVVDEPERSGSTFPRPPE